MVRLVFDDDASAGKLAVYDRPVGGAIVFDATTPFDIPSNALLSDTLHLWMQPLGAGDVKVKATYQDYTYSERRSEDAIHITNIGNVPRQPVKIELDKGDPKVFNTLEFKITLASGEEGLRVDSLSPSEMFNVYDTSRGTIDVAVVVSRTALSTDEVLATINAYYDGTAPDVTASKFVVPAFYARYAKDEAVKEVGDSTRWRARIGLVAEGRYFFYACAKVKPQGKDERRFPDKNFPGDPDPQKWTYENMSLGKYPNGSAGLDVKANDANVVGPISGASGKYFVRRTADGGTRPFFGLGYTRPWNLKNSDTPMEAQRWSSAYIDFNTQMTNLQNVGGNLFSWWLVSWDSNPVHGTDPVEEDDGQIQKYNEFWQTSDGDYERKDLNSEDSGLDVSKPYQYYDQGRSRKVDALFEAAESHNIAIMLTLWPHPELRTTGTGWDGGSTFARYGASFSERVGRWLKAGESADIGGVTVKPNGYFSGWAALGPSKVTDGQNPDVRNYLRYVVARWGCRRGMGLYELVSELGGTWLAKTPKTEEVWRNTVRAGINCVSPYKQPLSSSRHTTDEAPIVGEYASSHGYCLLTDGTHASSMMNDDHRGKVPWETGWLIMDNDAYRDGLLKKHSAYYVRADLGAIPVFCGEVGACQRKPGLSGDAPMALTSKTADAEEAKTDASVEWRFRKAISTFHYSVWTALLSKAAAAPLAWCDGKEFGEMAARGGNVRFAADHYALNYAAELAACHKVVNDLGLEAILPTMTASPIKSDVGAVHVFVMKNNTHALVWVYLKAHATTQAKINLSNYGVTWGTGKVVWINPWTGAQFKTEQGQNLNDLDTRLGDVKFQRAGAGDGSGNGPHEKEDVLLWVTK